MSALVQRSFSRLRRHRRNSFLLPSHMCRNFYWVWGLHVIILGTFSCFLHASYMVFVHPGKVPAHLKWMQEQTSLSVDGMLSHDRTSIMQVAAEEGKLGVLQWLVQTDRSRASLRTGLTLERLFGTAPASAYYRIRCFTPARS